MRYRLLATMGGGRDLRAADRLLMDKVDLPGVDWLLSFYVVRAALHRLRDGRRRQRDQHHRRLQRPRRRGADDHARAPSPSSRTGSATTWSSALALLYAALVLGFFLVNFPLGKIFLGDGGAYFCGFLLAALGVLLPARNPEVSAWTAILICAYPVIETLASMRRKARRDGHSVGQPDRVHFHMLAHRRYARRLVRRRGPVHLRNPATSLVTWLLPLLTARLRGDRLRQRAALSAVFFFLTVFIYGQLYRVMSLNAPHLPLGLARLL